METEWSRLRARIKISTVYLFLNIFIKLTGLSRATKYLESDSLGGLNLY